jgi:hypothetical protein
MREAPPPDFHETSRCCIQEVFPDETPNETRGPPETTSSRERIKDGFGTGGVVQEGFGTVLLQFDPKIGLKAALKMDVRLEDALESIK